MSHAEAAIKALQAEYTRLLVRWKDAAAYSQEVANLHATFKARERDAGRLFEDGTVTDLLSELDALRARCEAGEALLANVLSADTNLDLMHVEDDIRAHLKGAGRE